MRATTLLKQMLNSPGIIVAPGAYDGISARLIERQGFKAAYMTGAGTAASVLGQPDIGLTTLTEMTTHAAHIASCVALPVIADADTGYGNALNVIRTVREYERAGVAAIHLEDQLSPKKCGHIAGKTVIPAREFAEKIRAASENRTDPDFVIIARTDARAVNGLDDAIERALLYRQAGADVIFVEAPQTEMEIEMVAEAFDAPLLFNWADSGKSPLLPVERLAGLGYRIIIYPVSTLFAATKAMMGVVDEIRRSGTTHAYQDRMMQFPDFNRFIGLPEVLEQEKQFASRPN